MIARMRAERPDLAISPPPRHPPGWDAYKYARNRRLTAAGVLEELCATFTELAVAQARDGAAAPGRPRFAVPP